MTFGYQLLSWRRHRGLTQADLALKARLPRPYLSRLESDKVDPSLSLLRKLAGALEMRIGDLLDATPTPKGLSNEELDSIARSALRPGTKAVDRAAPYVRSLSRILKGRRAALGLYKPHKKNTSETRVTGVHVLRRLRADLGEAQWHALLKRVDKHAVFLAPKTNENF